MLKLARLMRQLRPDLIHLVALKGVAYGSLASRLLPSTPVVNAIAGLGYTFAVPGRNAALFRLVNLLLKLALGRKRSMTIFQNPDDLAELVGRGLVDARRAVVVRGSGVDTERFRPSPLPEATPTVLFASRLIRDKGFGEFVEAARLLGEKQVRARFVAAGAPDLDNPAGVDEAQLKEWFMGSSIERLGKRRDMPDVLSQATVVVLPSYREGLPKVLIEAAAAGRPIITTDVPGCREVVKDGVNGFIVPPQDAAALAGAIERMLDLPPARLREMGEAGRAMAESEFAIPVVVERTFAVYRDLTNDPLFSSKQNQG